MFYVRFLKVPSISRSNGSKCIKTTITITSDLGERFFDEDIDLYAEVLLPQLSPLLNSENHDRTFQSRRLKWKTGMRASAIEFLIKRFDQPPLLRIYVGDAPSRSPNSRLRASSHATSDAPVIINAWSDFMDISGKGVQAGNFVERKIDLCGPRSKTFAFWEESGNSIARHVWDAGVALFLVFWDMRFGKHDFYDLPLLRSLIQHCSGNRLKVLEIGCGIGLVGMGFASLVPKSSVLLSDLHEVTEIVNRNLGVLLQMTSPVDVGFEYLDWTEAISTTIKERRHELILVADCTYNADSSPALVKTLHTLTTHTPEALVVVALKLRHPSEVVFFDLMAAAGFVVKEECQIRLPMHKLNVEEDNVELIDVYVYMRL